MSITDATSASTPPVTFEVAVARASRLLTSNVGQAEMDLRQLAETRPDDPTVQKLLIRSLRIQKKTRRALGLVQALIGQHPERASLHYELALIRCDRGEKREAVASLRQCLQIDPQTSNVWLVLGDILFEMGDKTGADEAYIQHINQAATADYITAAMAALRSGDHKQAETVLRQQLAKLPTDLAALAVLGETLGRLGESEEAAYVLDLCVERVPSFDKARLNYVSVLYRVARTEEAVAQIDVLLQKDPKSQKIRMLKANAIALGGRSGEAVAIFEDLLAEFPDDAPTWTGYGHALRGAGRQTDAIKAYRRSAALDPSYGYAYWGIANLKTTTFTDAEITTLRTALAGSGLTAESRCQSCFALGKALEDRGDYESSFAYYAEGNALKHAELPFNPDANQKRFRQLAAGFPAALAPTLRDAGSPRPDPIFIVGLPRAGSTLIEQILDCHPLIEGTAELPCMGGVIRSLTGTPWEPRGIVYPDDLHSLKPETLRDLGEDYLKRTRRFRKTEKPYFTDKMPSNFEQTGFIHLILPNAKIIDARRHPLGCGLSNFKQSFSNGQCFSYDLTAVGRYYAGYVELMAHFDRVLPGRVHRVFHEDMVADPEREIRRLLDYCGLEFEPACLKFYDNPRQVRTVSSEQVRRPIFTDGVDQWRHYEPWLGPLKAALGPVLDHYPDVPPFGDFEKT